MAKTCGVSLDKAKEIFNGYWKLNWSIKEVSSKQKIIKLDGEMWLYNPINGFYYSLRKKNDIFSTLIQGTASYVFDLWLEYIIKEREQITGQFHDEGIWCVKDENTDRMKELCFRALDNVNQELKLNKELLCSVQIGDRYSDIH